MYLRHFYVDNVNSVRYYECKKTRNAVCSIITAKGDDIMSEVYPLKTKADIEAMKKSLHGRDLLLFIIGINSSLRISDIVNLKREDFDNERLILREKKTDKIKYIRINDSIRKALAELAPASGYLFPSRKGGTPITTTQAHRIIKAGAERAGITYNVGSHTMRKTFAYFAYKNGTDLALLMRILNHSSQYETLKYIGIERKQQDDVFLTVNL